MYVFTEQAGLKSTLFTCLNLLVFVNHGSLKVSCEASSIFLLQNYVITIFSFEDKLINGYFTCAC